MSVLMLENPLRDFAESLYQAPKVAEVAILLQDQYGVDVNVLLLMAWCGIQGYKVSVDDCLALDGLLSEQRSLIQSTRKARRKAGGKDKQSDLYVQLKAAELTAEYQHLAICYQFFIVKGLGAGSIDLVLANSQCYLDKFSLRESDRQQWLALVTSTL